MENTNDRILSTRIVAISHLSDAQELISMGLIAKANQEINFVKAILCKWHNDTEVPEYKINELWDSINQKLV